MGRAKCDGGFKIAAHPHGKFGQIQFPGQLLQQREMRAGRFIKWRDAHQAGHGKAVFVAASGEKIAGLFRAYAGLLRFFPGIYLYE